jgi:hypothetical protein
MCPILAQFICGTFELSPTGTDGGFQTFDIENIDWIASVNGSVARRVSGSGTFRISAEHQRLILDLRFDEDPVERYDSRLVPVGVVFPGIDVLASIGELFCYDEAVDVRAEPLDPDYLDLSVGASALYWSVSPDSPGYDVVTGDVGFLRGSGGDFTLSTEACLAEDLDVPVLDDASPPAPGQGIWYLVRGLPSAPYDSGVASQVEPRDQEIDASPGSCP